MSGDDGLRIFRKEADAMLSREARLEDMETVARLFAEVAALRAKAAAADRVRELADALGNRGHTDGREIRRALDGEGS